MTRTNANVRARRTLLGLVSCCLLAATASLAHAHGKGNFSVGVSIGAPYHCGPYCGPYYRPWGYPYGYYGYYPRPVYVAPAPIYVQPAPIVQTVPAPVYQLPAPAPAAPAPYQAPPPAPLPAQVSATTVTADTTIDYHVGNLRSPDERVRADSVMQLGRSHSARAVDPLAATLAGDQSPVVREAAARALGLLGSTGAMPALQRAAQADTDRDVRRSAQFAVEVIQNR